MHYLNWNFFHKLILPHRCPEPEQRVIYPFWCCLLPNITWTYFTLRCSSKSWWTSCMYINISSVLGDYWSILALLFLLWFWDCFCNDCLKGCWRMLQRSSHKDLGNLIGISKITLKIGIILIKGHLKIILKF